MSNVKRRVTQLENRATAGAGGLATVFLIGDDHQPLPIEEQERLLAEAHAEVGENGMVLIIECDTTGRTEQWA